MGASVESFRSLVDKAYSGDLQLPGFQRKWKWTRHKVITLYDSLRLRYPIGSLLFVRAGNQLNLSPRKFEGSIGGEDKQCDTMVLDGQQRLTAGIHLIYGTGNLHYFINIKKLHKYFTDFGCDLNNKDSILDFVNNQLDVDDGYCEVKNKSNEPEARLINDHLLWTKTLSDDTEISIQLRKYIKSYPDMEDFVEYVIRPHFKLTDTETIPITTIEANTPVDAVSRIFSTLNTTGQLLTSFELVVASLFPSKIQLATEVEEYKIITQYYENMDKTGETFLQTIALLAGDDPKKSALPKTIKPQVYLTHSKNAIEALEKLGEFLTTRLGAGLDETSELIPYDAIFAPMAVVYFNIENMDLNPTEKGKCYSKLDKWFLGAGLSRRYQEGTNHKQRRDLEDFNIWIKDDSKEPQWLENTFIPPLLSVKPAVALGKLVRCLLNNKDSKDLLTNELVGYKNKAAKTERHHIFPLKFVPSIPDWEEGDSADSILNVVHISKATNKKWLNSNPHDQIMESISVLGEPMIKNILGNHYISEKGMQILSKPNKCRNDFVEFLESRQELIVSDLKAYGFELNLILNPEDDDDIDDLG
jgi:hypothetical protein